MLIKRKAKTEHQLTKEKLFHSWEKEVYYYDLQTLRWLIHEDQEFKEWFKIYERELKGSEEEYILSERRRWQRTQNKLQKYFYDLKKRYRLSVEPYFEWDNLASVKRTQWEMFNWDMKETARLCLAVIEFISSSFISFHLFSICLPIESSTTFDLLIEGACVAVAIIFAFFAVGIAAFYFLPKIFWLIFFGVAFPLAFLADVIVGLYEAAIKWKKNPH